MAPRTDNLAKKVIDREAKLRAERSDIEGLWNSIARYMMPRKATFTEEVSPGIERHRYVLDSTAPRSLEMFASFLHTLLNNPSKQWFNLKDPSKPTGESTESKKWLEDSARRMLAEMVNPTANLYANLHETYLDIGAFGTSVIFTGEIGGRVHFRNYHLDTVVLTENADGMIDGVFRCFELTPRQAKRRWPDVEDLGASVEKGEEPVKFLHAVFPLDEDEFQSDLPREVRRRDAPFASVWVNATDSLTVATGTFEEFPYAVPRWYKVRGDIYGRSQGMTVLPDVRMVNRMAETILRGAEKLVDPPLMMPEGNLISPVRLFPGGLTFTDGVVEPKPLMPPGASRIEVGDALLKERQAAIREGFFVPLFVTPDSPVKTATQVLQEVDERNRAVSPMLIRMQTELFQALIKRVFNIMRRSGRLADPPPDMDLARIEVEYNSPLQASQRQVEALGTTRVIEALLPWAQIDPGVFDRFDPDEVAEVVHGGSGAPAQILRTKSKTREIRNAREQRESQQEQFGQLINAVEAGAKVAQATGGRSQ